MTSTRTDHTRQTDTTLGEQRTRDVDAIVEAAADAAREFRKLDQEQVDAIVEAMVRAGLRAAADLAAVAIEETGFGVFEDKVVKNFVATEFLHDYLRDKRSVGIIDEDVENNIRYVARADRSGAGDHPGDEPDDTMRVQGDRGGEDTQRGAVRRRPTR